MRARVTRKARPAQPAGLSIRLTGSVTLAAAGGKISATIEGYSFGLGTFSPTAAARVQELRNGLPLASFAGRKGKTDKEIEQLIRRLARQGLIEYGFRAARGGADLAVIEPQTSHYWPQPAKLGNADRVVLSRFAYIRRRGAEFVLESPRAEALFRICDPKLAGFLATLTTPQPLKRLQRQSGFPGAGFLALMLEAQFLFKVDAPDNFGARSSEGDADLVLWDFHDLLFHARSTEGRHANPLGGLYPHVGAIAPLPAVRPCWPGKAIELPRPSTATAESAPFARLLGERHSTREFDDREPITLAELSRFLDGAARIRSRLQSSDSVEGGPDVSYTVRPYPSGGSAHALELYLAVNRCDGLERGFYHYDAEGHALTAIDAKAEDIEASLRGAAGAMGVEVMPQIVLTLAARFGRVSWKYSALAYALILKDVGVLTQTLYLVATDLGLGGCAIGIANVGQFARMTGLPFHVEGPVGQFALGRGRTRSRNPTAP